MALREFGSLVINFRVSVSEMISASSISGPVYAKTKQLEKMRNFVYCHKKANVSKVALVCALGCTMGELGSR